MRLYRGKIPVIAEEMTDTLIKGGEIEVEPPLVDEVKLDLDAFMKEFTRVDREILEKAKDLVAHRGLEYSQTHRIRKTLAERRGFGVGDQALDWVLNQLIEVLLHSRNVDEVYAEDHDLRRQMRDILKKHTEMDSDLDREVRARIKNLQEGTQNWDIEYQRVMGDLRKNKNLD